MDKLASDSAKAIAELRVPLSEAEGVAKRVRLELETGAEKWTEATTDFQTATKRLTQLCADLQSRPWRSHWVLLALLLIATFIAGYFITLYRASLTLLATTPARAVGCLHLFVASTHRTRRDGCDSGAVRAAVARARPGARHEVDRVCAPSAAPSGRADRSRIRCEAMSLLVCNHLSPHCRFAALSLDNKLNRLRYSRRQSAGRALRSSLYGSLAPSR